LQLGTLFATLLISTIDVLIKVKKEKIIMKYKKIKKKIWILSKGKLSNLNSDSICRSINAPHYIEYNLSEIGKYLLNPNPIEVEENLIGYKIHFKQPKSNKIKSKIRKFLPEALHGFFQDVEISSKTFLADSHIKTPSFDNPELESHFKKISDMLSPYNPILKSLSKLNKTQIKDIVGICEDVGNEKHYNLNLKGSLDDKISYLNNNILKSVNVVLNNSCISDGLYEMRGFDFQNYDPQKEFKLIKFFNNGTPTYCVLNKHDEVDFWISDNKNIFFLHLLEHSFYTNKNFRESFAQCINGNAKPLRLYFSKQLEVNYSNLYIPSMYRRVFRKYNLRESERDSVTNVLNNNQRIVSYNYIPKSSSGNEKLFTNISVMHDIRALDSVKTHFPEFYSEISKVASVSEAGNFYLLDTMKGYKNV